MTKRIAMLTSTWLGDYTEALIRGIRKYMEHADIIMHVFNVYDFMEKTDLHKKEQDILYLADLSSYDGILVAYTSTGSHPILEELLAKLAAEGKKILCIDNPYAGQPYIGIDNYRSFYDLVEHMISVHSCKTFNYLGGPADHPENQLRYAAFCDCLKKHGLGVDPRRVLNYYFINSDGATAYRKWKEDELHLPDAVLCANDNMALGYCTAANEDGYFAPKDFLIAGFDNIDDAQYFSPSITSVNRNWIQLGYESMSHLLELIDGAKSEERYYVNGVLQRNESCGCGCVHLDHTLSQNLISCYRNRKEQEVYDMWSRNVLQRFCSTANDEKSFLDALAYAVDVLSLPPFAICLNYLDYEDWDTLFDARYTDTFKAYISGKCELIKRSQLLPSAYKESDDRIFFFSPLHFGTKNFGYCVVPFRDKLLAYDKHQHFVDYLALALECIYQRKMLQSMNDRLKDLYVLDQMTGLYNRFGYRDIAKRYFESTAKHVSVYYIDVDNLKFINDNYGHAMGDKAITRIADGIITVFSQAPVKVRMGGDEFLVMESLRSEEEMITEEQQFLRYLNEGKDAVALPFPLSASVGHIGSIDENLSLEELVHKVDSLMYDIKQKKKAKQRI